MNIKSLFLKMLDQILPPRCAVTGDVVAEQGMLSPAGWQSLTFIASPFCRVCGVPFAFSDPTLSGVEMLCPDCTESQPPFSAARAALVYDAGSRDLILRFKHADQTQLAVTFAPMLARCGGEILKEADMIVPVPLHRWRLLRRRYNQSALLALGLARECGKPCIPDALHRLRATPPQGHKRAKDRARNVRKAFTVKPGIDLRGRKIILVDDVYTTGATVRECAHALNNSGAAAVYVLSVARVQKGNY